MNQEERGHWYLLTGLLLGIALGLAYAWWIQPVEYVDTMPASLRQEFKDQYRALIAAAYQGNNDLVRARARLELLQDQDMLRALTGQAQRTLANAGSSNDARALGLLAIALGQAPPGPAAAITQVRPSAMIPTAAVIGTVAMDGTAGEVETPGVEGAGVTPTQETSTDTPAPSATPEAVSTATRVRETSLTTASATPQPASPTTRPALQATLSPSATPLPSGTASPSLTPGGPFLLLSREKQCDQPLSAPLIQVEALDRFNKPMPGILVVVTWQGGEERFYTGLKPEKGPGYADFSPAPGVLYALRLGETGQPEDNLAALVCISSSGERTWGAWLLKFVQP